MGEGRIGSTYSDCLQCSSGLRTQRLDLLIYKSLILVDFVTSEAGKPPASVGLC